MKRLLIDDLLIAALAALLFYAVVRGGIPQAPPLPQAPEAAPCCPDGDRCCGHDCPCLAGGNGSCGKGGCGCNLAKKGDLPAVLLVYAPAGWDVFVDDDKLGVGTGDGRPVKLRSDPMSPGVTHRYIVTASKAGTYLSRSRTVTVSYGVTVEVDLRPLQAHDHAFQSHPVAFPAMPQMMAPMTGGGFRGSCGPRGG